MNRKLISALLVLLLLLSMPIFAFAAEAGSGAPVEAHSGMMVLDDAELLTDSEEAALTEKLTQVSQSYNAQIVVATLPSCEGNSIDLLVEYFYDEIGFGYGENHDGVFLLVSMDPREYRILSNGFAGNAITGSEIDAIGNAIVSDLSEGSYAVAFEKFADQCAYYLDGYLYGFPFNFGKNLIIALVIGILAGVIVAFVLKGQLKSVRKQDRATVYVKKDSLQVNIRRDLFLYRTVSRTEKSSSSSSGSSSGSSRNVGGGSF